jgi:hypothetical protein
LASLANASVGAASPSGEPTSFCTPEHQALWAWLSKADWVIPVTARSARTFAHVALPFSKARVFDFGGTVTLDGETPDAEWADRIHKQRAAMGGDCLLAKIEAALHNVLSAELLKKDIRLNSAGLACFLHYRFDASMRQQQAVLVRETLREFDWAQYVYLHETDRDITILPRYVRKDAAVRYLIERLHLGGHLRVGLGDSLSDVGFLSTCHFMVSPTDSRITEALHRLATQELQV